MPKPFGLATLALMLLAAPATQAAEASFDCAKTEHEIEDLICKTDSLKVLDTELAGIYKQALAVVAKFPDGAEVAKTLKAEERGWSKGKNDCWKAQDKLACTTGEYERRIAFLQAQYMLVTAGPPQSYVCNNNPADEFVVTAMPTRLPTVRIARGDSTEIAWAEASTPGLYNGSFGVSLTITGEAAEFVWKDGGKTNCTLRK